MALAVSGCKKLNVNKIKTYQEERLRNSYFPDFPYGGGCSLTLYPDGTAGVNPGGRYIVPRDL